MKYLQGYSPALVAQAKQLLDAGELGPLLARKYPEPHEVRSDKALFDYAAAIGKLIREVETFVRPPEAQFLTPAIARIETSPHGPLADVPLARARSWLLTDGWRRAGPLDPTEPVGTA